VLPQGARSIARRRSWRTLISPPREKERHDDEDMTGNSEVERDNRKMKTAPHALTERTINRLHQR
jgi:hypothetical protein